jgi:hypothetical protein
MLCVTRVQVQWLPIMHPLYHVLESSEYVRLGLPVPASKRTGRPIGTAEQLAGAAKGADRSSTSPVAVQQAVFGERLLKHHTVMQQATQQLLQLRANGPHPASLRAAERHGERIAAAAASLARATPGLTQTPIQQQQQQQQQCRSQRLQNSASVSVAGDGAAAAGGGNGDDVTSPMRPVAAQAAVDVLDAVASDDGSDPELRIQHKRLRTQTPRQRQTARQERSAAARTSSTSVGPRAASKSTGLQSGGSRAGGRARIARGGDRVQQTGAVTHAGLRQAASAQFALAAHVRQVRIEQQQLLPVVHSAQTHASPHMGPGGGTSMFDTTPWQEQQTPAQWWQAPAAAAAAASMGAMSRATSAHTNAAAALWGPSGAVLGSGASVLHAPQQPGLQLLARQHQGQHAAPVAGLLPRPLAGAAPPASDRGTTNSAGLVSAAMLQQSLTPQQGLALFRMQWLQQQHLQQEQRQRTASGTRTCTCTCSMLQQQQQQQQQQQPSLAAEDSTHPGGIAAGTGTQLAGHV